MGDCVKFSFFWFCFLFLFFSGRDLRKKNKKKCKKKEDDVTCHLIQALTPWHCNEYVLLNFKKCEFSQLAMEKEYKCEVSMS